MTSYKRDGETTFRALGCAGRTRTAAWLLGRGALVAAKPATRPELRPPMEDDRLASGPRRLDCRRKPVTFPEPLDDSAASKPTRPFARNHSFP
ncbi:hypothetical protein HPB47_027765 [Ixodes persulcatus]|uniref:Uncharacterized protein n=1 Tax=Ixodes persulcatus TaxID=34615 RepID=A0AC60PW92_IXOPE|nr:hypothetical protein HPB47_027765 [Ixodes persulcatus]